MLLLSLSALAQEHHPVVVDRPDGVAGFGAGLIGAGDINGDGCDDVVVSATDTDGAWVYYGNPGGVDAAAWQRVDDDQEWSRFGHALSAAGDVNGDGYADFIVGAPYYPYAEEGRAFVYYGGEAELAERTELSGADGSVHYQFGWTVAGPGDVNGDGYDDVLVGAYTGHAFAVTHGMLALGDGSGAAPSQSVPTDIDNPHLEDCGCDYAAWVAAAGDVNGDSYADFFIAGRAGGLRLYTGGVDVLQDFIQLDGDLAEGVGDINGDGYDDYHVDHTLFLGDPLGEDVALPDPEAKLLGGAGDLNSDGYDDLLVWHGPEDAPEIVRYYGGPEGLTAGEPLSSAIAAGIVVAGDLNGDGVTDFLQPGSEEFTVLLSDGIGLETCASPLAEVADEEGGCSKSAVVLLLLPMAGLRRRRGEGDDAGVA